jgi:predicted N-formylglutamate amidohydrolase
MKEDSEIAAFEIVNGDAVAPYVIICDHASNQVPSHMADLGLDGARLQEHIALDIGAAAVSRQLADRLGCCAVLCGTSRLVVDCNRLPYSADWIPRISDGVVIPGNQNISTAEMDFRMQSYFLPYHEEIERQLDVIARRGKPPLLISIHSFTPQMAGDGRPWHVGILSDLDRRVADRLIENLNLVPDLIVGDNEPYSGDEPLGYALKAYNLDRGLPYAMFEIRQDLLNDETGINHWVDLASDALRPILEDDAIYQFERKTKP